MCDLQKCLPAPDTLGLCVLLPVQSQLSQIKKKKNIQICLSTLESTNQPALIYFKHQDLLKLDKVQFNPINPKVCWFLLSRIPDSHTPNIPPLTPSHQQGNNKLCFLPSGWENYLSDSHSCQKSNSQPPIPELPKLW